MHIHVRDKHENSSSDPELFGQVQEGVRKHCPGMIIQFSTGGRGREADQRGAMMYLKPDMASLATGSVNFPTMIYENPPELVESLAASMREHGVKPEVEVFDAAMLYNAVKLSEAGKIPKPLRPVRDGIPGDSDTPKTLLEFLVDELHELAPDATWSAMGVGGRQFEVNKWTLEMGGHARTGFER